MEISADLRADRLNTSNRKRTQERRLLKRGHDIRSRPLHAIQRTEILYEPGIGALIACCGQARRDLGDLVKTELIGLAARPEGGSECVGSDVVEINLALYGRVHGSQCRNQVFSTGGSESLVFGLKIQIDLQLVAVLKRLESRDLQIRAVERGAKPIDVRRLLELHIHESSALEVDPQLRTSVHEQAAKPSDKQDDGQTDEDLPPPDEVEIRIREKLHRLNTSRLREHRHRRPPKSSLVFDSLSS